jgi:hypothetical protein
MSTLSQIARHAIANAQSFLKFEKDRPAVYRDCLYDRKELSLSGSAGRLHTRTWLLLKATEEASDDDGDLTSAARLSLVGLCDWVAEELALQQAMAE